MNIKRFTARTSREALALVRQALGDDAVVLSTRPKGDGVEVLALPGDGMERIEQAAARSAPSHPGPSPMPPHAQPAQAAERRGVQSAKRRGGLLDLLQIRLARDRQARQC